MELSSLSQVCKTLHCSRVTRVTWLPTPVFAAVNQNSCASLSAGKGIDSDVWDPRTTVFRRILTTPRRGGGVVVSSRLGQGRLVERTNLVPATKSVLLDAGRNRWLPRPKPPILYISTRTPTTALEHSSLTTLSDIHVHVVVHAVRTVPDTFDALSDQEHARADRVWFLLPFTLQPPRPC